MLRPTMSNWSNIKSIVRSLWKDAAHQIWTHDNLLVTKLKSHNIVSDFRYGSNLSSVNIPQTGLTTKRQHIKHGICTTRANHNWFISIWTVVLTVVSVVLCQVQWPLTHINGSHSSIRHQHNSRLNPETLPPCCPITTTSRTESPCASIAHGDVISLYWRDQCGRVAHFNQVGNWKICTLLQICLHSFLRLWILFKTVSTFIPWFSFESSFKTVTFLGAFAKAKGGL